ncbi:MAG: sigma-54-dependent Fis family transcriptional regulator [Candidatus Omnitrophica bacterium]|nr:sigma-54-dependent Fis family transcriptional regulator [Candidatus Omnitrophota bacterium]
MRVIVATNQNLEELINQGKFRKDLFYRLNIISIEVPPLRDRKEDIPLLVKDFIKKHAPQANKKISSVSDEALQMLCAYHWPGNIRELENVIERATILSKGSVITPVDLPEFLQANIQEGAAGCVTKLNLKDALKSPERDLIVKALDSAAGNRNKAAEILGINRTTLYKKMRRYGLLKEV